MKKWLDAFETSFLRLLNDLVYIHLDFTPKKIPPLKGEEKHEEKERLSFEISLSHTTSLREIEDGYRLFLNALLHKLRSDFDTTLIPYLLSYSPARSSVFAPFSSSSSSSFSLSLFSLSLTSAALSPCAALWSCRGRVLELLLLLTPPHSQEIGGKKNEAHSSSSSSFAHQANEGQSKASRHSSYLSSRGTMIENAENGGAPRTKKMEEDIHRIESSRDIGAEFFVSSSSGIDHDFLYHITSFSSFLQAFLSRGKRSSSLEDRAKKESLDQGSPLSSSSLVSDSSSPPPPSGRYPDSIETSTASQNDSRCNSSSSLLFFMSCRKV